MPLSKFLELVVLGIVVGILVLILRLWHASFEWWSWLLVGGVVVGLCGFPLWQFLWHYRKPEIPLPHQETQEPE